MKRERRKIKLINPSLQLRFVGAFAVITMLSFLLQGLFVASRMSQARLAEANGGGPVPNIWIEGLLLSLGLFLPLTIAAGILMTHRIAGPIYRIEQHLRAILRGENPPQCTLRKGDELVELCALMNKTIEHLREGGAGESQEDADERRKRFRAVS